MNVLKLINQLTMYTICNFLIFILTLSSCIAQDKFVLQERQSPNRKQNPSSLVVSVIIDTIQYRSTGGIQFRIMVENEDGNNIILYNILDNSIFGLIDETYKNIMYPQIPKLLINNKGNVFKKEESFKVVGVKINGKDTADKNVALETVNIPPKGSCEILLRIEEVLSKDAVKPYNKNQLIEIMPGSYQFTSDIFITTNEKKSYSFRSNRIKIRYK